jgi:TP901-1 family phage major tail protein
MAVQNGTNLVLKLATKLFVGETSSSLNLTSDMIETTTKSSTGGAKTYIPGEIGATISASGMYDPASSNWGWTEAVAAWKAGTSLAFIVGGTDAGDKTYTGSCYITSASIDQPQNDKSTWSAELQVTGEITETTLT